MLEVWGNAEYLIIAIASRSPLVAPDRVLSMGQIGLTFKLSANK